MKLMLGLGLPGAELRERKHLDPVMKRQVRALSRSDTIGSRRFASPSFPGGQGNRPLRAPERIAVRRAAAIPVGDEHELRLVALALRGQVVDWHDPEGGRGDAG